MRSSLLSRSVVAVASLAIGSVALAAAPANAASASGVTRDQVLTAVNGVRTANAADTDITIATSRALRAIIIRACDVRSEEDEYAYIRNLELTNAGDDADGLLITARVYNNFVESGQDCTFAAFAAADGAFQLSGSATISAQKWDATLNNYQPAAPLQTAALSEDAFVTAPLGVNYNDYANFSVTATGNATRTTDVTTSTKVATPKTTKQKKAAKKAYDSATKSAKKSYTKALKKAGDSKKKKAAAKKAYSTKKATAKAKYSTAIASFKIVKTTSKVLAESRPFSITTVSNDDR